MHPVKKIALAFAATASLGAAGMDLAWQAQDRPTPLSACLAAETPPAQGAPVILVPGFMNNDAYMGVLAGRLQADGYTVYGWEAGLNTGPDAAKFQTLQTQLAAVHARHGQKVAVVGYSLGGVYARELARAAPEYVSMVVTLGAPFGLTDDAGRVDSRVAEVFYLAHGRMPRDAAEMAAPLDMPAVSVYGRADRIVPAAFSQLQAGPDARNIAVNTGHIALPFNREVAAITAWYLSPAAIARPAPRCHTTA